MALAERGVAGVEPHAVWCIERTGGHGEHIDFSLFDTVHDDFKVKAVDSVLPLLSDLLPVIDNVDRAILDPKPCQYLYHDDDGYHFMDMESYHSFALSGDSLADTKYYLKENMELTMDFYEGNPVTPEIPKIVTLKVTESPPWVRGDSVSNNLKPAVCETGLKIQVPIFIKEGEEIKVNTESGEYVGRA